MSLIEAFEVIQYQTGLQQGLAPGRTVIGGRFDVYARFRRDAQNAWRELEFRQYIRGETRVNDTKVDMIRVPVPGGGTRPIHRDQYYEDGDPTLGSNAYYGHRNNQPVEEDYYYNRDPATGEETRDMLGGDHYLNYDIFGLRLTPIEVLQVRNKTISMNLQFKVQIVRCDQPGGRPVAFFDDAYKVFSKIFTVTVR